MDITCQYIPLDNTGYFTQLSIDYSKEDQKLKPFYNYPVSVNGVKEAIIARQNFFTDRPTLVNELRKQYGNILLTEKQQINLESLLNEDAFTICTAHQPVIFTGPLYFIYKIFHVIKLADTLNTALPQNKFVPVFYMGSEDADLDELGHIHLHGEKLTWVTEQTGAVGRMKVDKALLDLIDRMAGELEIDKYGRRLIDLFRAAYTEGQTIQQATLWLVNELFNEYGLLVVIPDNPVLKSLFSTVVNRELESQFSHHITAETIEQLSIHYKPQAGGRDLNLFYLTENNRERIELQNGEYVVKHLDMRWGKNEILEEAKLHPERFSANVMLRPLFQETILPNIVFIGGGGETAYWLELKNLFGAANIHFPMLLLRNSFLFVNEKQTVQAAKLGFNAADLFMDSTALLNALVKRESDLQLNIENEKQQISDVYINLQAIACKIDASLAPHTQSLQTAAIKRLDVLEKKMLRAEKRKFEAQQRQLEKLRQQLFPDSGLQERVENFASFFARYGDDWMRMVYEYSLGLEQKFAVIEMKDWS